MGIFNGNIFKNSKCSNIGAVKTVNIGSLKPISAARPLSVIGQGTIKLNSKILVELTLWFTLFVEI